MEVWATLRRAAFTAVSSALVLAAPAAAQPDGGERIRSFHVDIVVHRDATMTVTERIEYDFGSDYRRGIERAIPVRYEAAPDLVATYAPRRDPEFLARVTPIELTSVIASPGTPTPVARRDEDEHVFFRIGDPDITITGVHTYVLTYEVAGALNEIRGDDGVATHDELYWNVTGNGWSVPIDEAVATVTGPGLGATQCYRGYSGDTTPCDRTSIDHGAARSVARRLDQSEGLTVVASFSAGSVGAVRPLFEERFHRGRAFRWEQPQRVAAAVVALVGVGGALAATRRRLPPAAERLTPAGVLFRPPDDAPPAVLGTLVDARVDSRDVSSTIVDLAVRGYLRVEATAPVGDVVGAGWVLKSLKKDDGDLRPFEQRMYRRLFGNGDEVRPEDLHGTFSTTYFAVVDDINDELIERGWYATPPTKLRLRWFGRLFLLLLASIPMFILTMALTTFGWAAAAGVTAALVLFVRRGRLSRPTPLGATALARTRAFQEFLETAEVERFELAEREQVFLRYLPYAMAFGNVDRWARAFAGLDLAALTAGNLALGVGSLDVVTFTSSIARLQMDTGARLAYTPASNGSSGFSSSSSSSGSSSSSSSGSSGGGMGGGGGGSW